MYPALLLLASCAAGAGALPLCLVGPVAVSHRGNRGGRRFGVVEVDFFPSGASFARPARDLMKARLFVSK